MKKNLVFILFLFLFFIFISSYAQFVGAGGEENKDIGKIYVEEQKEQIINGLNSNIQTTTTLLGDIINANGKVILPEILKYSSGIYFEKSGIIGFAAGGAAPSVLKIRGLGELPNSGILILIDERPQYMGIWRHPLFDTLALDSFESVEIIKGPSGVELGNQAVAGAIKIKTQKIKNEGFKIKLNTAFGNYYTQDYFCGTMGKISNFDLAFSAGYRETDGARPNSDSYHQNYTGHLGYELGEWYFDVNGNYSYIRAFNPGPTYAISWDREQEALQTLQRAGDVRVKYENNDTKFQIITYTDSGHNNFLKTYNKFLGKLIDGSYNRYQNYGLRLLNEWYIFPGNITKIGFDWQYFGGYFDNRVPTAARKIEERYENDYAPYISFSQDIGIFGIYLGTRYGINNKWGQEITPQFGLKVELVKDFIMHINLSKGYKTPAMGTVIWATYDELKPENFWQYELGLKNKFFEILDYDLTIYQIEGNNLLQTDPVDKKLKNTGFILIRGIETGIETKILDKFIIGFNTSYTDPGDKTARFAYLTGKVYTDISFFNDFSIKIETEFARDRFDDNERQLKLEEYTILNTYFNYKTTIYNIDTNFYLDIENMFDRKYQIKTGYPNSGFLLKSGILINI